MADWIEGLERLKDLREKGHLTEAEFHEAKRRLLEQKSEDVSGAITPSLSSHREEPQSKSDEHALEEQDFVLETKTPLWKRVALAILLIGPLVFGLPWVIGKAASFANGDVVPAEMVEQCVGYGAGDMTERPLNQPFKVFVAGIKANGLEPTAWESSGENQYIFRVQDADKAKKVREDGAFVIRLVDGNGGSGSCGPKTLRIERMLANDQDAGASAMVGIPFTVMRGMQVLGIKPQDAGTRGSAPQQPSYKASSQTEPGLAGTNAYGAADQSSDTLSEEELAATRGPVHLMVGLWVPQGEYCASGASIRFKPGGTWETENGGGSWRFEDDDLSLSDKSGRPSDATTDWIGGDEFTANWQDGTRSRWRRCPSDGSTEPWFRN